MFGLQAPGSLGGATGVGTLAPGFGYSDSFDLDLSVINWTQGFAGGKAGYAVGRLDFAAYLDAFPFQTFSRGFINRSFILNPAMATTGTGAIGAVLKGFVSGNTWIGAQMYDANAVSGEFDLDTIEEGEWLKAIEIGFTPSFAQRKSHLLQLTYWQKNARELAGTTQGEGWVMSAAYDLGDDILPFVRLGQSDGEAGVAAEDAPARAPSSKPVSIRRCPWVPAGPVLPSRPSAPGWTTKQYWRLPTSSSWRRTFR